MSIPLRILFVEDDANDMRLEIAELHKGGFQVTPERVDHEAAMRLALSRGPWDVIISDHRMPMFSSHRALAIRDEVSPDTPFLIISGSIGEDAAVAMMKAGAQDYIGKNNLRRLVPAVQRELREAVEHEARRNAEARLVQAQKMEAVGQLAGGVAHDFNNLLTVIGGYSDLLLMKIPEGDPHRREIVEIRKAAERATVLTRQLLTFSRRAVIRPVVLDLNAVVADVHQMLRRLIGASVELITVPQPALDHVKADPGHVEQVLMNLAVNARDAIQGSGRLTFRTRNVSLPDGRTVVDLPAGNYVALDATDTGCGMTAEGLAPLWEPFFTTKGIGKGTGLGLATVYGIVQQGGGAITVASKVGAGTTFTILWPAVDEPLTRAVVPAPSTELRCTETVVVVDDAEPIRRLAREILTSRGYQVLEAGEGLEAVRVCGRHPGPIHLVLTDVVMPLMNGVELAKALAPLRPEARIVFMSGYLDRGEVPGDPGCFLQKPFTPDSLAGKVREVLDAHRSARSPNPVMPAADGPSAAGE